MKILYYTSIVLPSHCSNRTQVAKMCDALSDFTEVFLLLNKTKTDIQEKYIM